VAQALARLPSEPDVVQACEFGSEAFWYALGTARRAKLVTRLATPTFVVAELTRHAKPEVVRNRALGWLEHVQTARSDAIISPTDALADVVCRRWRMPRGGVTTMRTGVDFAQRYASAAHELPAELENREFVLYFGRLEERKGVHILAQALPAVLHAHPNLHVVFAGNNYLTYKGQPMERYVQQCNAAYLDRLHFFSRLPQNELHTFLARALFVVLPSLWEALANATLESQDMGKAVVATHGCGFGEVVQDGRTGVLVPPGNVMALRDAILRLLGDRDLLKAMSSAAHVRGADFHMERVTPQLVDFYQSLFARRAPVW
jgi:glycosyltransferase involved in cell wall biosynthesis